MDEGFHESEAEEAESAQSEEYYETPDDRYSGGQYYQHIPELDAKNENGRNSIHFHAFRAWFKTQVTDAHQSDFAEALMGHKSLRLLYYRQNDKVRARTYLDVEHAVTISDTEKIDRNYSDMQKDNSELRGIVDSLSRQLKSLEKRIEIT